MIEQEAEFKSSKRHAAVCWPPRACPSISRLEENGRMCPKGRSMTRAVERLVAPKHRRSECRGDVFNDTLARVQTGHGLDLHAS